MSDRMTALIEMMGRIAIALEAANRPAAPEGFFGYGRKIYCNLTKGNGDGWYTVEDGNALTQQPIFRGRIVAINFPTVERNEKEVRKFHLLMRANGEVTTFESGYDCFFSKSILATLAATSADVLAQPIQIASYVKKLKTGDKTLAVSVRDHAGNQLASDWTNDSDWRSITAIAMENIEAAI